MVERLFHLVDGARLTYGDGSVTHTVPVLEAAYNKAYQSAHDLTGSLNGLDTTVQDLARDGVVTEAEAAAVKKAKQDVDKEREEATSQFNSLKSNKALSAQFVSSVLGPRYTKAFGTTDEGGTYGAYADKVDKVLLCKTAEELKAAMYEYDAAYGAYSSAVKDYAEAATGARHAIEQKNAADYADGILSAYDEQMDQKEMFDRLTKGGTEQGIYMQNDRVYINASYMATGTIADKLGRNSWNLTTGTLKTNYMTANNITANGTFKCGYTNWYTMLTSAASSPVTAPPVEAPRQKSDTSTTRRRCATRTRGPSITESRYRRREVFAYHLRSSPPRRRPTETLPRLTDEPAPCLNPWSQRCTTITTARSDGITGPSL